MIFSWKQVYRLDLKEGDTIVMGSDGLFDNVFDHEIVSTIFRSKDVLVAGGLSVCLAYHFDICLSMPPSNQQ